MEKNNLCISTFILNNVDQNQIKKKIEQYQEFDIVEVLQYENQSELQCLKNIILKAKTNEDDAIFIIKGSNFSLKKLNMIDFFESIFNIVDLNIPILIFEGNPIGEIAHIKEDLFFITQLKDLEIFVLLNSVFDFILEISDGSNEDSIKTVEDIINLPILKKVLYIKWKFEEDKDKKSKFKKCLINKNKQRINVIVPFRNVNKYLKECCDSILSQNHTNFRVFFIDDCSSDNSIEQIPNHTNFTIIKNNKRKFALQNIHEVLIGYNFDDQDVIAVIDGDDTFYHEYSLDIVNSVYSENKNCLVSYGTYIIMNNYQTLGAYTKKEFKNLRNSSWKASHLKTFKFKVYKEFLKQDPNANSFKNGEGAFYKMTYDMALMFPLMEISGFKNVFNINYPIYCYRLHENNDHVINRHLQYEIELEIRTKQRLKKVF